MQQAITWANVDPDPCRQMAEMAAWFHSVWQTGKQIFSVKFFINLLKKL